MYTIKNCQYLVDHLIELAAILNFFYTMKTTRFIPGLLHFEQYATDPAKLTVYNKIRPKHTVPRALTLILPWKCEKNPQKIHAFLEKPKLLGVQNTGFTE